MNRIGVRAGTLVAALSLLAPAIQAGLNHWTPMGPEGGPISLLVADPRRPGSIYASSGTLVFHSSDRGDHWARLDLSLEDARVVGLVIDPRDSRLYLAGSEALLVSDDGGGHWSRIGQELSGLELRDLALDSANPDVLAVATSEGVWISSDRGANWRQSSSGYILEVWASGSGIFSRNTHVELEVTRDGGQTWAPVPVHETEDLAFDSGNPDTIYVSTYQDGILKSTDGGRNWSSASSGLPTDAAFRQLHVDPMHPGTVYTISGFARAFVTGDAGASWQPFDCPADIASMAFDAEQAGTIHVGSRGQGVFRSADRGEHWENTNQGLSASAVYDIEPLPDSRVFAAVSGQGLLGWSGDSWLTLLSSTPRYHLGNIDADLHQPGHVFAVIDQALYETTDGGATWQKNPVYLGRDARVAVSRDRPQTIYLALADVLFGWYAHGGVIKSTDGGIGWNPTANASSPTWDVVVSPGQPNTAYIVCGDRGNWSSQMLGIYKTTDGGASWKQIHPDEYVYCLLVDPQNPDTVYAGARGVVYKSTDAGGAWHTLSLDSADSVVVALAIDPREPAMLWAGLNGQGSAGSKSGVFVSSDGGLKWQEFNYGLGCRAITCLTFDPVRPHTLYAGTEGGGVWSLQLDRRRPGVQRQPSSRPGR